MKSRIEFRDTRAPHEILFQLERRLRVLFQHVPGEARLTWAGSAKTAGDQYGFLLRFEAAAPDANFYSLEVEWSPDATSAPGWIDFWTGGFKPAPIPRPADSSPERYRAIADQSLAVERGLDTVEAVQQEIVSAVRNGATYSTSHKEGGSTIRYLGLCFIRADYGESQSIETFWTESSFLRFLRRFYEYETSGHWPEPPTEYQRWRLILRMMDRPRPDQGG